MTKSLIIVHNDRLEQHIQSQLPESYRVLSAEPLLQLFQNEMFPGPPVQNEAPGDKKTAPLLKSALSTSTHHFFAFPDDRPSEYRIDLIRKCFDIKIKDVLRVSLNDLDLKALRRSLDTPTRLNVKQADAFRCQKLLDQTIDRMVRNSGLSFSNDLQIGFGTILALKKLIKGDTGLERRMVDKSLAIKAGLHVKGKQISIGLSKTNDSQTIIPDKHVAKAVLIDMKSKDFYVRNKTVKKRSVPAPDPLDTLSLLRHAEELYQYSVNETLRAVRELYEGVNTGVSTGLVSYYLTESRHVPDDKSTVARDFVYTNYGSDYLSDLTTKKTDSSVNSPPYAISPVNVQRHPNKVRKFLTEQQFNIYNLIWSYYVAAHMTDARMLETHLEITDRQDGRYVFETTFATFDFRGFRQCSELFDTVTTIAIADIAVNQPVALLDFEILEAFSEPQPSQTEAQLIDDLMLNKGLHVWDIEETIEFLYRQQWVHRESAIIGLTDTGYDAAQTLMRDCKKIFEISFARQCLLNIEAVANGKMDCQTAYNEMGKSLATVKSLEDTRTTKRRHKSCPQCGAAMVERTGKYGRFIACSRFPACKETQPFPVGVACPEQGCNGQVIERYTPEKKLFYGCSQYPTCSFAAWSKPVNSACPKCGSLYLLERGDAKRQYQCPQCKKTFAESIG